MGAPAVTAQPGRASHAGRLLAVNFAACLLLLIQYLLGMAVNLYIADEFQGLGLGTLRIGEPGVPAPGATTSRSR